MGIKTKLVGGLKPVYLTYGTIISPLGTGIKTHENAFHSGETGVSFQANSGFNKEDFYLGKIESLSDNRYSDLLTLGLDDFIKKTGKDLVEKKSTLIIVSTTKANLNDLETDTFESTRKLIQSKTNNPNTPIFISNACISGVLAVNSAADYIRANQYDDVIVIGIDALYDFVVYGFQSLYALSNEPSKPFDKERKGISIGEACGIIHVTAEKPTDFHVEYLAGASSNDANHISGPSRTGEGLVRAIQRSIERANIESQDIDFISAHGTGTLYNDEMESIAFSRLNINSIPINSLKGYFGHTLGAAGVIELLISMISSETNTLFKSYGFEEQGTSEKLNIIEQNTQTSIRTVLKTASGFGGGNAALIFQKGS